MPVLRQGAQVISGVRTCDAPDSETRVLGDLTAMPDLQSALTDVDCIVHCAGRAHVLHKKAADSTSHFMRTNCDATLHLARQAEQAGVARLIFISSIGVNGNRTSGQAFKADDPPAPQTPYAVSKLAAEEALANFAQKTNLEVVIIRPPLIIGPEPVGNLGTLSRLIGMGIPLPFGLVTGNRRSLVSAEVLADLVRLCLTHANAPGQTLLVADHRPLSTREILERLVMVTGQRLHLIPMPVAILRSTIRLLGQQRIEEQLFGDLEVDISSTTNVLGWSPPAQCSRVLDI